MTLAISVAINSYNRAAEIEETLDAVLSQSLSAVEVVVVDDGSTDETGDIVSRFGNHVRYIYIDNVGPGQSRHHAVTNCKSKWVATCDSDDLWEKRHLESLSETIRTFEDAVFVFSNNTRFGPEQDGKYDHFASIPSSWWDMAVSKRVNNHSLLSKKDCYTYLLSTNPVYPSCSAFRSDTYTAIGGAYAPFSRITSEDSALTRRLSLAGSVACNSSITARMRKHEGHFSESIWNNLYGKYQILDRHVNDLDLGNDKKAAAAAERDRSLLRAFRHAYWERDLERAALCASLIPKQHFSLKDRLRYAHLRFSPKRADKTAT